MPGFHAYVTEAMRRDLEKLFKFNRDSSETVENYAHWLMQMDKFYQRVIAEIISRLLGHNELH